MSDALHIKMLGGFSITYQGRSVDDQNNRTRKIWLLLAYLIHSRHQQITQSHYLNLLQSSGGEDSADPNGKLKVMFHRARTMLNQVDPSAGHDWIIRKNGTYAWNSDIPMTVDVEEFERLCSAAAAAETPETQLELYQQALELYLGDFLPKLNTEPWAMPISTYYHQMYLHATEQALLLLEQRGLWHEIANLSQRALTIEPYSEALYQALMRARIAMNDRAGALRAYDEMSELLFSTFGVLPSDESRALYRDASRDSESLMLPVSTIREQLREPSASKGALYCEYDFFKMLYQLQARALVRNGDTIHIGVLSVQGQGRKELSRRSLDRAMDNLQDLTVAGLRQGDVVTRCSVSQLIIMLPQANYENSCAVCQRILRAFSRQYPHSPVEIRYSVQPVEPLERARPI